jgi:predicted DNA-binding transcriptional regulator AlpA
MRPKKNAAAAEPAARLDFPNTGFVRLRSILAPNGPVPVGRTTWWEGVKSGRFPKPLKLGPRITVWRAEDIHRLIATGVTVATDARPTYPQPGDCHAVSAQSAASHAKQEDSGAIERQRAALPEGHSRRRPSSPRLRFCDGEPDAGSAA